MRSYHLKPLVLAVTTAGALLSGPANAVTVSLCGPTICYEYDNNPLVNTGVTLYGNPTLLAGSDFLEFTPTNFYATASNGSAQTLSVVFQFSKIYSLTGGEITFLGVSDSGDYRILNGGAVADSIRLQVVDQVNNNSTPGFPEVLVNTTSFSSVIPTGFTPQEWSLTNVVSPSTAFTDLATVVNLQIQNNLDALTYANGQYAWIAKKLVLVSGAAPFVNQNVPVPAAAWLFASAAGALGWLRRRPAAA